MIDLLKLQKDLKKRLKDELQCAMYQYYYTSVNNPKELDALYNFKYNLDDNIDEIITDAIINLEEDIDHD